MARELTERTASILDSASTWEGVRRVVRSERRHGTTTLRVDGRAFGRVETDGVEACLPGKLPRTVVRHGLADAELEAGWTRLDLDDASVHDAVVLLRVAYLSHVAQTHRNRADAFQSVDLDAAIDELDLSPGTIHLVREQARP